MLGMTQILRFLCAVCSVLSATLAASTAMFGRAVSGVLLTLNATTAFPVDLAAGDIKNSSENIVKHGLALYHSQISLREV